MGRHLLLMMTKVVPAKRCGSVGLSHCRHIWNDRLWVDLRVYACPNSVAAHRYLAAILFFLEFGHGYVSP